MAMKEKCPSILLLLALTKVHMCARYRDFQHAQTNADQTHQSQNIIHNATTNCGDYAHLRGSVAKCQRDLWRLALNGNVWFGSDNSMIQTRSENNQNTTYGTNKLRDPLDSLHHACSVYNRSRKCLKEKGVMGDYCLNTVDGLGIELEFRFICQHQRRGQKLIRSLQCLRDNRLLVMLFFHIANHCVRGMDILDDLMTRIKNATFYMLNINNYTAEPHFNTYLFCLPRHVISTCVAQIVKQQCGKCSSDLVQNYLQYLQDRYGQSLTSAGLSSNICEYKSTLSMSPLNVTQSSSFARTLEIAAPGTALDTVIGRFLLANLQNAPGPEICGTEQNVLAAYTACAMSSDDKFERSKFNILQFGQGNFPLIYHGTQCTRLQQFKDCWNQLQQMCGSKVRGFAQHATLLVDGCKIQSKMDTAGCHWQDMLLGHYIQASRVTVWPSPGQGLGNPLFLEPLHSKTRVMNDLDKAIKLLQPGVEEIAQKCGLKPAKHLKDVLRNLRYLQRDTMNAADLLSNKFRNITEHVVLKPPISRT